MLYFLIPLLLFATPAFAASRIANPASVKCVKDGYKLEIRKDKDGGEYGICIDKKGNECEEWAYFHGECKFPKTTNTKIQIQNIKKQK